MTEQELARRRLRLLDAYLEAADRRIEVLDAVARADGPEEAAHAVAKVLSVDQVEASGIVDLRLLRFTKTELDSIRNERDSLRRLLEPGEDLRQRSGMTRDA